MRRVKLAVRDLCILRMIHAFCEAAPMLLLQLYLLWLTPKPQELSRLHIVSASLSLFSICWSLASYSKYMRGCTLHRLVLTWLGVLYQLGWRLGTVSSRAVALSLYASMYGCWLFLVLTLHWICMLLWLLSPRNMPFRADSRLKRFALSACVAYLYVFCYVNLNEGSSRYKLAAFYVTMLLENSLLTAIWLHQNSHVWYTSFCVATVWGGFVMGIAFMVLYYRYFHIRRLKLNQRLANSNCSGNCSAYNNSENLRSSKMNIACVSVPNGTSLTGGVFNCRLNPAFKRKKKKPTSFVPPPVLNVPKIDVVPFWKKPFAFPSSSGPPESIISANSGVSRVDIQQKLQEKKQQQLQELREIEEEIKQGKLVRPQIQPERVQPIPQTKRQPWPENTQVRRPYVIQCHHQRYQPIVRRRSKTPEVLLAPHYLEKSRVYYDYSESKWKRVNVPVFGGHWRPHAEVYEESYPVDRGKADGEEPVSDVESQFSLPRSYTLPREYRYYKPVPRNLKTDRRSIASNNSSDADVDSEQGNTEDKATNDGSTSSRRKPSIQSISNQSTGGSKRKVRTKRRPKPRAAVAPAVETRGALYHARGQHYPTCNQIIHHETQL